MNKKDLDFESELTVYEIMQNTDYDLFENEISRLVQSLDTDIDRVMESISQKAWQKLKKENADMKIVKSKKFTFIAAALIAVLAVSAVYASDITGFLQSFLGKRQVYQQVVDGSAFYLKEPVLLDGKNTVNTIVFTEKALDMQIVSTEEYAVKTALTITSGDKLYTPGGISGGIGGGDFLSFYNGTDNNYTFFPKNIVTVNIAGKSYDIELSAGEFVTDGDEIKQAERDYAQEMPGETNPEAGLPKDIDWLTLGFKKTEDGVQILASFDDPELSAVIGAPLFSPAVSSFDYETWMGGRTSVQTQPLLGQSEDGGTYEYVNTGNMAYDTFLASDAPLDTKVVISVPAVIAQYGFEKEFTPFSVTIPGLNEELTVNREIDLALQKLNLRSVKRTSETTAELLFDMNTGDKAEVSIYNADISSSEEYRDGLKKIDAVWGEETGTVTLTFDSGYSNAELYFSCPSFTVNGGWKLSAE